jgi:hypothetical protein
MSKPETFEGPRGLRGFLRMNTTYGARVELQESSAAVIYSSNGAELDGPFSWLRVEENGVEASAHLSVAEMRALRRALNQALRAWDVDE